MCAPVDVVSSRLYRMVIRIILLLSLLTISTLASAQYPFDSLPKPGWSLHNRWKKIEPKDDNKLHETITVQKFYNDSASLTLQFTLDESDSTKQAVNILRIYKGNKVIQSFRNETASYYPGFASTFPIRVGDITGDGKKDIKIVYDYHGNGLGMGHRPIYLLQQENGRFIKYSFQNSFTKRLDLERDFDGDGKFEIISVRLMHYNAHNYWQFDVLKADGTKLTFENEKYGYPIFVQFLYRDNFKPANIKPRKDQLSDRELEIIVDTGTSIH